MAKIAKNHYSPKLRIRDFISKCPFRWVRGSWLGGDVKKKPPQKAASPTL
jgi:hypothetical protein